jgi:hypothetical protein
LAPCICGIKSAPEVVNKKINVVFSGILPKSLGKE